MKLGIDLDDVVADFIPVFRKICQDLYGRPHENVWPCDWAWSNFGLSKGELDNAWAYIAQQQNFHLTLPKKANSDLLTELADKHQLFFITARRPNTGLPPDVQSAVWLEYKFGLDHPTVILSSNKIPIIKALELNAFIDDRADTCEAIAAETDCKPYLCAAPHNAHCSPEIARVENLNEFARLFL